MSVRSQTIEDLVLFLETNSDSYEIKFDELQTIVNISCSIPLNDWEFFNLEKKLIQFQINKLNNSLNNKEIT